MLTGGFSYPHLTRFFAHLCLFMQMIDVKVDPDVAQRILEAYLQVLEVRICLLLANGFHPLSPSLLFG